MDIVSTLKSETLLTYKKADVQFLVEIAQSQQGDRDEDKEKAMLRISVKDSSGEKGLAFTEECSPILADFGGGFLRWLSTLGITASHTGGEITGAFRQDYNAHRLIRALAQICEMIEHRFSLYLESILT